MKKRERITCMRADDEEEESMDGPTISRHLSFTFGCSTFSTILGRESTA
jgi:hypothetical protein